MLELETSANGVGASVEAAAAAAPGDQGGVAELGFGLAGASRWRGSGTLSWSRRRKRRRFTAEGKARILAKVDACTRSGEVGELLRAEGLYTSHLAYWRKQRKGRGA